MTTTNTNDPNSRFPDKLRGLREDQDEATCEHNEIENGVCVYCYKPIPPDASENLQP